MSAEINIEQVPIFSRMYLATTALRACQLSLIEKSEIPKKTFGACFENSVIASITTKPDLEKVIPTDIDSWDADTIKLMFQRSLNIFEVQQPVQEQIDNAEDDEQIADTVPVAEFRKSMHQYEMII